MKSAASSESLLCSRSMSFPVARNLTIASKNNLIRATRVSSVATLAASSSSSSSSLLSDESLLLLLLSLSASSMLLISPSRASPRLPRSPLRAACRSLSVCSVVISVESRHNVSCVSSKEPPPGTKSSISSCATSLWASSRSLGIPETSTSSSASTLLISDSAASCLSLSALPPTAFSSQRGERIGVWHCGHSVRPRFQGIISPQNILQHFVCNVSKSDLVGTSCALGSS
mmetsp:Transcript_8956/g.16526  ORF Transcript_8956/g.16526 Transcript_8956/m.16526 type:complete len:230 (-) Transcript_8956:1691-2380(-)